MKKTAYILVTALFAVVPFAAYADPGAGLTACKMDIQSLCSKSQPGQGHIVKCLEDNSKQLSKGCSAALQRAEAHNGAKHGSSSAQVSSPSHEESNTSNSKDDGSSDQ